MSLRQKVSHGVKRYVVIAKHYYVQNVIKKYSYNVIKYIENIKRYVQNYGKYVMTSKYNVLAFFFKKYVVSAAVRKSHHDIKGM